MNASSARKLRKLLIATPLREGASSNYLKGLLPVLQDGVPGFATNVVFLQGPAVNFARNELAYHAVAEGYDELVMVDEDLRNWELHLPRLLSHDADIVSGIYCKRKPGKPTWLFVPKPGAVPDSDGLLECTGVPTGFLRIKVRALRDITESNPNRRFGWRENDGDEYTIRTEWFPMGIVGGGAAERRLEDIQRILLAGGSMVEIEEAANGKREPGRMLGEDYYFSHLARKSGLRVFVDTQMGILPHIGEVGFPITESDVGWRGDGAQEMPRAEEMEEMP